MDYNQGDAAELKEKSWQAMTQSSLVMLQLDSEPENAHP
jgi:hypothetical protein